MRISIKYALNNFSGLSNVAKASMIFIFVNILQKGLAFLTSPIYTRLLTTDEFGQVSIWFAWHSMIGVLAMFCLSSGVFNNGMLDYPGERDQYSYSMLIFSNVITVIVAIIMAVIIIVFGNVFKMDILLLILMFAVFLTQPAYNFWMARQRYEYKYKKVAVITIASAVISPVVAIICIYLFNDNKVYSRLLGGEIILIAIYTLFYIYLALKAKLKVYTRYWKIAFLFNLPLIPHYFSSYILNHSDRLMIAYLVGDTYAAFYSLAYSISAVLSTIWLAINSALIPFTYEKCRENDYKSINDVTLPMLLVFAAISFVVILIAPELILILATKAYAESVKVVPPIVGGVFIAALYYIFANIVYYYRKPKYVMVASIVSAIVNIILNYIYIPIYGYVAAGYTTIFCYALQALLDYFVMKKVVGQSVYNIKLLCAILFPVVLFSLISAYLYDFLIARYAILLVAVVIIIIFRKKILSYFKLLKNI
ncbi:MAG: lipopolysaccharide biosynthesis protein [Pelotomaculum sp.]|jgi:O-antigen/teichoic acid export membrane protein